MEKQTIAEIRLKYPDQWVLIGDPETQRSKVLGGVVIFHSMDKREIAYSQINWREQFKKAITIFTGEKPKHRKFWL